MPAGCRAKSSRLSHLSQYYHYIVMRLNAPGPGFGNGSHGPFFGLLIEIRPIPRPIPLTVAAAVGEKRGKKIAERTQELL